MQVPERRLYVGLDLSKPIILIDCDIFLDGKPIELDLKLNEKPLDLNVEIESEPIKIDAEIDDSPIELTIGVGFNDCSHEYYHGSYLVIPKFEDQVLDTDEKLMKDNVIVKEIPVHEVSNAHGYTLVIGD